MKSAGAENMTGGNESRRTAIVTGGRRGIGKGIALALAKAGFDIAVIDAVEDEACEHTLSAIRDEGRRADFIRCDIGDLDTHASMIERAAQGRAR